MAILDIYCIYWTVWDRYMQVLFLGRAPRTKETLPDFLKWRRITRPSLVFRGLTGSQRTPRFWGVTISAHCTTILQYNFLATCILLQYNSPLAIQTKPTTPFSCNTIPIQFFSSPLSYNTIARLQYNFFFFTRQFGSSPIPFCIFFFISSS